MKKFLLLFITFLLASCSNEEVPSSVIHSDDITIGFRAGQYELAYSIENGTANDVISAVSDAGWISEINTDIFGKIVFSVTDNKSETERSANLKLSYGTAKDVIVKVTQQKYDPELDKEFLIEFTSINYTGCTVKYTPVNYQGGYLFLVMDKSAMDKWIDTDNLDGLYKEDLAWLESLAENNGVSLGEYLKTAVHLYSATAEPVEQKYSSLNKESEYYAYCYGLSLDGEKMSNVIYKSFRTVFEDLVDMSFEARAENVTESSADIIVTPSTDEYPYYWTYVSEMDYKKYSLAEIVDNMILNIEYYCQNGGYTIDDFIHYGESSQQVSDLWASTKYYVVAWGMSAEGKQTTGPRSIEVLTTLSPNVSDPCTFTVTCPEVKSMDILVNVVPSNMSTRYYIAVVDEDKCSGYNDDQMVQRIINMENDRIVSGYYGPDTDWSNFEFLFTGEQSLWGQEDLFWTFKPDHNYNIYVFGVDNTGKLTTKVAKKVQKTAEAETSEMTFEVELLESKWNSAHFKYTPSNNDEYYLPFLVETEELEYFRNSDGSLREDELMEEIEHYYDNSVQYYLKKGEYSEEAYWISDTEYSLLIFGYAGTNTTPFYEFRYKSPVIPFEESSAEVSAEYELFDGAELYELDPERWDGYQEDCIMYIKFYPNEHAVNWYGGVWLPVDSYEAGIDHLMSLIMNPVASFVNRESGTICPWFDYTWSFSYVAEGSDGKFGKWHYEEFTPVKGENMSEPYDFWSETSSNSMIISLKKSIVSETGSEISNKLSKLN